MGIINDDFPRINKFPEPGSLSRGDLHQILPEVKGTQCKSSNRDTCGCLKWELPPEVPKTCPFPPTEENIGRLEQWIRERYRSSTFNTCNNQPLPLMKGSPPIKLFIDPDSKPVACHKLVVVLFHRQDSVREGLD